MKTDYTDRMVRNSHVREVGPHVHDWEKVGQDNRGDVYQECQSCGARRIRSDVSGRSPLRQDWLEGAPWTKVSRKRLSDESL